MLTTWTNETIMFYFNNRLNNKCVYVRNEYEWNSALLEGKIPVSLEHFTIFKVNSNAKELEDFLKWLPENIYTVMGRDTVILAFPFEHAPYLIERYLVSKKEEIGYTKKIGDMH